MPNAAHVRYVDEDTFERLHIANHDQFLVAGEGDLFEVVSVLSPEFDDWFGVKFHRLPQVGFIGLTKQGGVVANAHAHATPAEVEALAFAAASLALSEAAVARRAKAAGAIGFLESLAKLVDPRGDGASNA